MSLYIDITHIKLYQDVTHASIYNACLAVHNLQRILVKLDRFHVSIFTAKINTRFVDFIDYNTIIFQLHCVIHIPLNKEPYLYTIV
jgi:hypothetical protein